MMYLFKAFGILGLLSITWGIFIKNEVKQDLAFALGGVFLLAYSAYLHDPIFIVLQTVFILSSMYEMYKLKKAKPEVV